MKFAALQLCVLSLDCPASGKGVLFIIPRGSETHDITFCYEISSWSRCCTRIFSPQFGHYSGSHYSQCDW